jgi:hypothetical protein
MNINSSLRPKAADCLSHPWLLKKTDEPVDPSVTLNSLRTLRRFRVRYISINIL